MKIKSYKKKNNNLYEITFFNNDKISLYDDVILKYELIQKKELDEKLLDEIIEYNSKLESYYVALKYINSKLRTENEIKLKLMHYSKDAINYTIDRLKENGYLNDELYIKSYINDEVNLKFIGPNKIIYNLKKLGFNDNEILNYLDTFNDEVWLNKINNYVLKKIHGNHNLSGIMLKQKLIQELQNKGFYKEHVMTVINEFDFVDESDIKEREYQKIKRKLSKKYSGEELEYNIKISLLKKGFKNI